MRNKFTKLLSAMLAIIMAVSLFGCGSTNDGIIDDEKTLTSRFVRQAMV